MSDFADEIKASTGVDLHLCSRCRRCSSGCPVAAFCDLLPDRLVREILLGSRERVLSSKTPWLCTSCGVCGARCPERIDLPAVMAALSTSASTSVLRWRRKFTAVLAARGRIREASLLPGFHLSAPGSSGGMEFWMSAFLKGKLPLFTGRVKDMEAVRKALSLTANAMEKDA